MGIEQRIGDLSNEDIERRGRTIDFYLVYGTSQVQICDIVVNNAVGEEEGTKKVELRKVTKNRRWKEAFKLLMKLN